MHQGPVKPDTAKGNWNKIYAEKSFDIQARPQIRL